MKLDDISFFHFFFPKDDLFHSSQIFSTFIRAEYVSLGRTFTEIPIFEGFGASVKIRFISKI